VKLTIVNELYQNQIFEERFIFSVDDQDMMIVQGFPLTRFLLFKIKGFKGCPLKSCVFSTLFMIPLQQQGERMRFGEKRSQILQKQK